MMRTKQSLPLSAVSQQASRGFSAEAELLRALFPLRFFFSCVFASFWTTITMDLLPKPDAVHHQRHRSLLNRTSGDTSASQWSSLATQRSAAAREQEDAEVS